jgi:hypothetical protein
MSTTQQDKPGSKSRKRSRKAEQRGQQPDQAQSPNFDQPNEEQIGTMVASTDALAIQEAAAAGLASGEASAVADVPVVAPSDAPSMDPGAPTGDTPIGVQTIANAYRSYARKSMQQTGVLAEKLMGARSLDKAVEVQTEFAREAYANFVADSGNIWELHSRLVRETFTSWQRLATGAPRK